jgi:hypothetical protein
MGLSKGDLVKQAYMSSLIQFMKDMNNRMISYEQKGNASSSVPGASSSSLAPFRNTNENTFQPKAIMACNWCKFRKENYEESTCEVKRISREKIFGKRPNTMIIVLHWVEPEDVMVINTRNKSYTSKGKYDLPHTYSTPSPSSQSDDMQAVKILDNQGVFYPLPSSNYNILNQLSHIKVDGTLWDMVFIPEQQKHLKKFMEGKFLP